MQRKNYKLIVFDIDDTVLYGNKLSKANAKAILNAKENGAVLAVATGRQRHFIPSAIKKLNVVDYYILANGATVVDAKTDEVIYSQPFVNSTVNAILHTLDDKFFIICTQQRFIIDFRWRHYKTEKRRGASTMSSLLHYLFRVRLTRNARRYFLRKRDAVYKMIFSVSDRQDYDSAAKKLDALNVNYSITPHNQVEVSPNGVSKGLSLKRLCDRIGIAQDDVIAFGDSENDVSMSDYCDCFVAMGQSSELVKSFADDVALSAEEDGFAKKIEEVFAD